jgi:hypothetical protein
VLPKRDFAIPARAQMLFGRDPVLQSLLHKLLFVVFEVRKLLSSLHDLREAHGMGCAPQHRARDSI